VDKDIESMDKGRESDQDEDDKGEKMQD